MHFRFVTNSKTLSKTSPEHIKLLAFLNQSKTPPPNLVKQQVTSAVFKEWIGSNPLFHYFQWIFIVGMANLFINIKYTYSFAENQNPLL